MSTDRWGIDDRYEDALHTHHVLSDRTRAAIRQSIGDIDSHPADENVRIVRRGAAARWDTPGQLLLEDGAELTVADALPPDLPLGYHRLLPRDRETPLRLIVCPPACTLPLDRNAWGWAVQLYATRSEQSWGMGDLADLRRLATWAAGLGASFLLANPLHAVAPLLPQQASPYYPASRRFRNPLYLRIDDVPGARAAELDLAQLAAAGRALNATRRIDRDAILRLKLAALEKLWARFSTTTGLESSAFERYCGEQGTSLVQFAQYCVLAEQFGGDWRQWPGEYRSPTSAATQRLAESKQQRVRFHQWLQWLVDEQLAGVARTLDFVQDLPIGVDPGGADAWAWQDVLAPNMSIGAPPDLYNTQGQNWGLPPFIPHKLRALGYEPFIQTIRATLRHAAGLRIDHVMGLFRLFWIPEGFPPADGAYVRHRSEDLLAITALESHRQGAFVVGEDLGTVEDAMREDLGRHNMLSYRLVWFEEDEPATYPALALAAVTTHDLPTIAGLWSGSDLAAQQRLDLKPNVAATQAMRKHLQDLIGVKENAPVEEVVIRTHRLLATAPSLLVTATLEDALAVEERPNMPGTIDTWPNWSLALPQTLEEIEQHPLPQAVAEALNTRHGDRPSNPHNA